MEFFLHLKLLIWTVIQVSKKMNLNLSFYRAQNSTVTGENKTLSISISKLG